MAELGVAEKLASHLENPPGNGAAETVVESLGKEYRFSYPEQRFKGQFEQWLVRNAIRTITDCEKFAADETDEDQKLIYLREAEKQRAMFSSNRSAGLYNWMGAISRKSIGDLPGTMYLCYLFLKRCHPTITEQEVCQAYLDQREKFNEASRWALGKEMALLERGPEQKAKA